jgi:hypothetical protein
VENAIDGVTLMDASTDKAACYQWSAFLLLNNLLLQSLQAG